MNNNQDNQLIDDPQASSDDDHHQLVNDSDDDDHHQLIDITITDRTSSINQDYLNLYINLILKYERESAVYVYHDEMDVCGITLEKIEPNDYYYKCSECQGNFKMMALKPWLKRYRSCPRCRCKYTSFPVLYHKKSSLTYIFDEIPKFLMCIGCYTIVHYIYGQLSII